MAHPGTTPLVGSDVWERSQAELMEILKGTAEPSDLMLIKKAWLSHHAPDDSAYEFGIEAAKGLMQISAAYRAVVGASEGAAGDIAVTDMNQPGIKIFREAVIGAWATGDDIRDKLAADIQARKHERARAELAKLTSPPMPVDALRLAIKLYGRKQTGFALALTKISGNSVSQSAVSNWLNVDLGIPVRRAPEVEWLTGVPCELLYPDVNWKFIRGTK